jgi:hypothetical protein
LVSVDDPLDRRFGRAAPVPRVAPARREFSAILRESPLQVPNIRAAGEPDYLLSSFTNDIRHLACEFS